VIDNDEGIFEAIKMNNFNKVFYLINHVTKVNTFIKNPDTYWTLEHIPLPEAILAKNIDIVRLLLDQRANGKAI
jgi:hypothetical protein